MLLLTNVLRADGGVETALANVANGLDGERFDVWVVGLSSDGPLRERLAIPRDRIVSLGARDYPGLLRCVPVLARLIERKRIQVVHSHLFPAHLVGWLAARAAGVEATVVTEHSILHPEKTATDRLLERAVVARAGQLVAVSRAVRDARARQLGVAPDRFLVVPNSVPIAHLPRLRAQCRAQKREELGISADEVVVTTVGRLEREKGQAVLISAVRTLVNGTQRPTLLIVGEGSLAAPLQGLARRLGLGRTVRFLGLRSDVYELLAISDVFALPSLWEGLPVALLEAEAYGLPVVASDVGGVREAMIDGRTGFLVLPGDRHMLGTRLRELVADAVLRARLGRAAKVYVRSRFDSELVVPRLEAVYEKLVVSARR